MATAALKPKAKKPRAKTISTKNELYNRYGHFGDAHADDSVEEARQVRAKMAKLDDDAPPMPAGLQAPDEFARNYQQLFGKPYAAPTPAAVQEVDWKAMLMRSVHAVFSGKHNETQHLQAQTTLFAQRSQELAATLFQRIATLFDANELGLHPELTRFHELMREHTLMRNDPAPEGQAAKRWRDACQPGQPSIPVNAGYRILTLPSANVAVAVPRNVAHMLGVCHAVYHLIGYMSTAILSVVDDELHARLLGQPLDVVWSTLCGGEPWATQTPVAQWKWPASPPLVQTIVQLRSVVETAKRWSK